MGKDMNRRCSHCGNNGHNTRTCSEKGLKLFGVRILDEGEEVMRKSKSMGNLTSCVPPYNGAHENGYLSDGPIHSTRRGGHERKRGVPWTEEEHRTFLAGLEKLGKGDWRGISRNFVITKTPTQVASHAQKYFLRQSSHNKKKRRSSLFDMVINDTSAVIESPALCYEASSNICSHAKIFEACTTGLAKSTFTAELDDGFHKIFPEPCSMNMGMTGISRIFPTLTLACPFEMPENVELDSLKQHPDHLVSSPDFLRLSFPPLSVTGLHCLSSKTSTMEGMGTNDLELTIAPPQPFGSRELPSDHSRFSGAIVV